MVSGYFITTNNNDRLHSNAKAIKEKSNAGGVPVKDIDVPSKVAMDKIVSEAI